MKLKFGRILSLVTASAMIAAALTACVNNSKEQSANRMLSPEKLKTAEYPLQTDEELTIWMRNHTDNVPKIFISQQLRIGKS